MTDLVKNLSKFKSDMQVLTYEKSIHNCAQTIQKVNEQKDEMFGL